MKKKILFLAVCISSAVFASAQAREDKADIMDASRSVLSIELKFTSKTVSDALTQKLKEASLKTKSSKGYTIAEGAKFLDISPENLDYYFKVESKDKTASILYLGFSKGYTNFVTPESDAKVWTSGKEFLNNFITYMEKYQLELDIAAQDKIVKDAEKAYEKAIKEGEDLAKKVAENAKDQETKKAELQKHKETLEQLNLKKAAK